MLVISRSLAPGKMKKSFTTFKLDSPTSTLGKSFIFRCLSQAGPHLALQKESQASYDELDLSYPKDEPGEEVSERARVWRVYLDEAAKFDLSLAEGCNRGIDVLLVFVSKALPLLY